MSSWASRHCPSWNFRIIVSASYISYISSIAPTPGLATSVVHLAGEHSTVSSCESQQLGLLNSAQVNVHLDGARFATFFRDGVGSQELAAASLEQLGRLWDQDTQDDQVESDDGCHRVGKEV